MGNSKIVSRQISEKSSISKMFLNRSEYDRSPYTFSPEGRLFQVEYALEAIKLGSTAIGVTTSEGVVLAAEKRVTSSLMEPHPSKRLSRSTTTSDWPSPASPRT